MSTHEHIPVLLFRKIIPLLLIAVIWQPMRALAQATTNAAGSVCACNGSMTYTNTTGSNQTYILQSIGSGVTYNFNGSNGFAQTGLCAGTYTLQVLSNGNTTNEYITVASADNAFPPHTTLAVCSTTSSFNLANAMTGLSPNGFWLDPQGTLTSTIQTTANAQEGFYAYIDNSLGCPIATGVYIDINEAPNTGNQTTTLICDTWAPFDMLVYMQGAPDPGGDWYTSQGVPMNGIFNPATMASQLFTYIIDDVPGCATAFTTMYIQENATPNPGLPSSVLVCAQGTPFAMFPFIEGSPSAGGTWTNPNNQSVGSTFTPGASIPGEYTYSINALTPCVDQDVTLTIDITNADPSGQSTNLTICSNTPGFDMLTALDGTPVPGGTWTNSLGTTISGSFSVQNTGAGTYNYYFPNVGCNPQGATLNILVEPLGNAGNSYSGAICSASGTLNLAALLSAGSSANGVWYNASNQIISPVITLSELAEQEYTYFINGGVCPDDYSFFDIIVDSPPMDLPDTTLLLCSTSGPIDLIASLPPAGAIQFLDQNGLSVSSIFDPSAGASAFYSISIPSGNICAPGQGSINIQVENPINLDPADVTICENTTTINLEQLAPSFALWNGAWFLDDGTSVNPVTTWDSSMLSFYFVPNEALVCPVDTGFLNIQVSSFQASSALPSSLYCELDPAFDLMTLLPTSWSNNGAWSLNNTSLSGTILNPINASSGNYLYTIPGIGSCPEATLTVPISITQLPSYAPIADLFFCADQNQVTLGSNETNNAYAWSPGLYLDDPSSAMPILTADLVDDEITILEYTVSVSNAACTLLDTVQVTFYPQPQIELSDVYSLCLGQSLNINLPLGNQYAWEPSSYFSNPNASAQNIQPLNSSNIFVTVENVWGCQSSLSAFIDVNTNPDFELEFNPQSGCYVVNDTLYATGLGEYTYAWNIAGEAYTGSTIELTLYDAGIYSLEIIATDSIGCQTVIQQESVYEVYPNPTAIFEADPSEVTTVNNLSQMINLTTTANQFQWQLDGAEFSTTVAPLVTFPSLVEQNYEVCLIATNATGCQDTSCIFVHIESEYLLWAPNAFTPDGDQINDVFEIQSSGFDATQFSLRIYDRWGLEVFSSTDPAAVWTGNHANGAYYCQPDVYSWIIEVKPTDMADYLIYKGHVNLIR